MNTIKKTIVTIGGGNGHSTILSAFDSQFLSKINLTSIVSMSDDGRTTGALMKEFKEKFGLYLPPPGDLRRCLFALSESEYGSMFAVVFETQFDFDEPISSYSLLDLFVYGAQKQVKVLSSSGVKLPKDLLKLAERRGEVYKYLLENLGGTLFYKLPLDSKIAGHKCGNLIMANLFYHMKDYELMLDFMHTLLEVKQRVLPVTIDKATIEAVLENGEIVHSQDAISNIVDYNSRILELRLSSDSASAYHGNGIATSIKNADYIVIAPGDLYTSTISNLIIGGVKEALAHSTAKIIYIANNTNKGGETNNYKVSDFIHEIEKYLGKPIDILIVNTFHPNLHMKDLRRLKENISVKGGEFIYLKRPEKVALLERNVKILSGSYLDKNTLYKHNKKKIANLLKRTILK